MTNPHDRVEFPNPRTSGPADDWPERALERGLTAGIASLGQGSLGFKLAPTKRGIPDRLILHGGRAFFVELKTSTGRLSPAQQIQHERFRLAGFEVWTAYGREGVRQVLEAIRNSSDS